MNQRLFYIALCFLFLLPSKNSIAGHFLGGEITWECDTNEHFIFKLNIYRECIGALFPFVNQSISYQGGNITLKPDSALWLQKSQGNISHIGPSSCQLDCFSSPEYGAVQYFPFVSDPIVLNGTPPPNGFIFTWSQCCRSTVATNLQSPGGQGITLRAIMYPYKGKNTYTCYDSSPIFAEPPKFAICNNTHTLYNPNGYDTDLDSLSFSWAQPWSWPNMPVVFSAGYSYDSPTPDSLINPLNIPAVIDEYSGEMSFKVHGASSSSLFVNTIGIDSYRNGVKIASVFRDIPFWFTDCPNIPIPSVIGGPGQPNSTPVARINGNRPVDYRDTVYAGEDFYIPFQSIESDIVWGDTANPASARPQNNYLSPLGYLFSNDFSDSLDCADSTLAPCATLTPAPTLNPVNGTMELKNMGGVSTLFEWQTDCNHLGADSSNSKNYNFIMKTYDDHCDIPGMLYPTMMLTVLRYQPEIQQNGNILSVDPAESYQWYFNGNPIPNSDTNKITASSSGIYSVEVVKYACNSQMASYNFILTGTEEIDLKSSVKVYPNPFKDGFIVELPKELENFEIELLDINGRKLKIKTTHHQVKIFIDPDKLLPTGVYLLRITSKDKTILKKISKI